MFTFIHECMKVAGICLACAGGIGYVLPSHYEPKVVSKLEILTYAKLNDFFLRV